MKIKQKIILISLNIVFILFANNGYSESIREKLIKARHHEQQMRDLAAAEREKAANVKNNNIDRKIEKSKRKKHLKITKRIKNKRVELYVAIQCSPCVEAENFLKSKNVKFRKYDILKSVTGGIKYNRYNDDEKNIVPIIVIGREVIKGYRPRLMLKALMK